MLRDVRDGVVSAAAAERDYAVAIAADGRSIDEARARLRSGADSRHAGPRDLQARTSSCRRYDDMERAWRPAVRHESHFEISAAPSP